ncbi:MAG: dTDP-4-dehydrorhamnose 3,5-epimerase [Hyphomicrobiales bacterium]|nr:dTDP-4-dehydrorhamnose 3,5-epimerase [Hyphomicrobiales bacterium]
MEIRRLELAGVIEIIPRKFGDERGYFAETYSRTRFLEAGIAQDWLQDNQSFSRETGVLRGLHFQVAPFAQDKLIRVLRGSILDVAVDIRKDSPTFRRWVSCTISAAAFNQLLVPKGFAHGFVTLEPETEVLYKVSAPYSAACDRSIFYADPAIGIKWPQPATGAILSDKDRKAPQLADIIADISFD